MKVRAFAVAVVLAIACGGESSKLEKDSNDDKGGSSNGGSSSGGSSRGGANATSGTSGSTSPKNTW